MATKIATPEQRESVRARQPADPEAEAIAASLDRAEVLLKRSLYEFGAELRQEIEVFLDEPPLLGKR